MLLADMPFSPDFLERIEASRMSLQGRVRQYANGHGNHFETVQGGRGGAHSCMNSI